MEDVNASPTGGSQALTETPENELLLWREDRSFVHEVRGTRKHSNNPFEYCGKDYYCKEVKRLESNAAQVSE